MKITIYIEISKNKKYTIPDLDDDRTMQESIKRVRELLNKRISKSTVRNEGGADFGRNNNNSAMDIYLKD